MPRRHHLTSPIGPQCLLGQAKTALAAVEAGAMRHNWEYAIAVVDFLGELVAYEKMDGSQLASGRIAEARARAAALFRRATRLFQDYINSGQVATLGLPGVAAAEGGVPLVVDGKLIGAIGASGGTSAQDNVVAQAGVGALKWFA